MNIGTIDMNPVDSILTSVRNMYVSSGLKYGWKSNIRKDYDYGHWNNVIVPNNETLSYDHNELFYLENHPLIKTLWDYVQECIGERTLVRAYCNGYTFGTDAYYHKDDTWIQQEFGEDCVSETILIYLNDEWDRDWGGETSLIDDNDKFLASFFPDKSNALVFDSNIWHRAGTLSRSCPELRSVLVFKTAGPEYNRSYVKWIKDKTETIDHSGVTLFKHLYNTAMTASSKKGLPHHIIKAALYHSVYDTEYFKANLNVTREEVIEQIGEEAENLVHIFCTTKDRHSAFMMNDGNWDSETQFGLLMMELSNLMEMSERRPLSATQHERAIALDAKISSFELEWNQ